ncbi:MAG: cyclic nucleotide-binding domain-containing protein [Deltaproteobacteria bacterium]|nr:cyclic nucleotide-binding domain-containing protein [Deltaproteobacteria bacterium]
MFIQQTDLFQGMDKDFIKETYDLTVKESFEQGKVLFREGDRAGHFYILLKGQVRLGTRDTGQVVHTVSRPGEAFGWSSLVGRDIYSASAECIQPTKLLKIDREDFQEILEKDPINGLSFFRRLAGALGERLINSYGSLGLAQSSEEHRTYGSSLTLQQSGSEIT